MPTLLEIKKTISYEIKPVQSRGCRWWILGRRKGRVICFTWHHFPWTRSL